MSAATYSDLIFGDAHDWNNFLLSHHLDHANLYGATIDAGHRMVSYPIMDMHDKEALAGWLQMHQQTHQSFAEAWGSASPPNMQDWDLSDPEQFQQWVQIHANQHALEQQTAGL